MKTTLQGKQAEIAVADQLRGSGYKIIDQNWKTPRCEIDIIAQKGQVIYFVEVKFRASSHQGEGLDYILPRKLRQLRFAARIWNQQNDWSGDWRLMAAAVTTDGLDYIVQDILELE